MSFFQAIFLAVVQGISEFLPISSSGHLVIFQKLFNLKPPVLFDILVHVGTLGAILIYFRKELFKISPKTALLVILGTVPAGVAGLFLQNKIIQIFDSLRLAGICLLITSGLLFSTRTVKNNKKNLKDLKWQDALFIGFFQALAILPGISRSGSTIAAGLWRKAESKTAFFFSFCLATPAILGALILQAPEFLNARDFFLIQGVSGMIIAGVVGYLALKILEDALRGTKLWVFGIYCFLLGIIILLS